MFLCFYVTIKEKLWCSAHTLLICNFVLSMKYGKRMEKETHQGLKYEKRELLNDQISHYV